MILLDINILIYSIRHPASECALKVARHTGKDLCISVITYSELVFGAYNSSNVQQNLSVINSLLSGIKVLDFDSNAGRYFGMLLADRRKKGIVHNNKDRDLMIAAHALSLGCVLVTDNLKDFADIPDLSVQDWIRKK